MREYPTDEELQSFIENLEKQELYAPRHLKPQILEQAFPEKVVNQSSDIGRKGSQTSVLVYRLKIMAGMAAALLMLAILPALDSPGSMERTGYEQQEEAEQDRMNVNAYLNDKMRQVRQKINVRSADWNFARLQKVNE